MNLRKDVFQAKADPARRSILVALSENSRIHSIVTYPSLKDLETVIQMGLKEGLTMAPKGLDELLTKIRCCMLDVGYNQAS